MDVKQVAWSGIAALAVLVGAAGLAAADGSPEQPRRQSAELKIEELKARLNLSPEQEQRLAPLVQDRNAKLKALRERSGGDTSRRARLATLKEARGIQERFIEQAEPILTKEQIEEWEAIRAELRATARERLRERR